MKKPDLNTARPVLSGFFLLVFLLVPYHAAANNVSSTFTSDLDGWIASNISLSWDPANGNPAGSLYEGDINNYWAQLIAPAKFHGAWLSTGSVSADIQIVQGSSGYPTAFAISDGDTVYYYLFSSKATADWQTFTAPLSDTANWKLTEPNGYPWYKDSAYVQGSHSLAQVLANVSDFRIRVDWNDTIEPTTDAARLDNIRTSIAPLPSTILFLVSALACLTGWRCFRKS